MTPEEILAHWDHGSLWAAGCGLDMNTAHERALSVRQLRVGRGETPIGFKIGFTNRNIWPRYQVFAPIWGPVWDTTVRFCEGEGNLSLVNTCQPRLEPEAVFGIRATPPANPSLDDLFDCIEWVAPGFEVVQSHLKDWKFAAADTVADCGLHARLLVGARLPIGKVAGTAGELDERLGEARVALQHAGKTVEEGAGANVLDSPLRALLHFVLAMRQYPGSPELQPGDLVTTGTWTDAWPVEAGQEWTAQFEAPLSRLTVRFT